MPHYDSPSPSPPPTPSRRRMKSFARKCERFCCTLATYFPLAFVYSLTTWAVWTNTGVGFRATSSGGEPPWSRKWPSILGLILYLILNTCYTVAVFTDPGSPLRSSAKSQRGKYSVLPTSEPTHDVRDVQTITVSSTGNSRYCKKCQVPKPDRTHHCSTCKRCVLKMDHHCPWLATCLGLHNYKAFVLFLIYTSIYCWVCFLNTASWIWTEVFDTTKYLEDFAPVNVIILAVISAIIGLVLTGFTSWHIYLSVRGQTTIECLEKTRYLSKMRKQVELNRQEQRSFQHKRGISEGGLAETLHRASGQILEFHANAVPGASRYEEGEEHSSPTPSVTNNGLRAPTGSARRTPSPSHMTKYNDFPQQENASAAQRALRQNYSNYEADREQQRYEEYLDDKDGQKMPNAFDLGWKKNLLHLFGPIPWLWFLPICNTTGDGWRWEVSPQWLAASEEAAKKKEERIAAAQARSDARIERETHSGGGGAYTHDEGGHSPTFENRQLYGRSAMSMQTFHRPGGHRQRRDFDRGENGEMESFQVSDSGSETSSEDSDSDVPSRRQDLQPTRH